jgi:sec-independent protein translocase protein TatB
MFDFAWPEIALIGVVALVAIGPKDMPAAIKAVAGVVKKARRMAGEFQVHLDDLVREADLGEVRQHMNDLRSLNLRGQVERALDPDGSLRSGLAGMPRPAATDIAARPDHVVPDPAWAAPPPEHLRPDAESAPAFIPPDAVATERARRGAPAFIPPAHALTTE